MGFILYARFHFLLANQCTSEGWLPNRCFNCSLFTWHIFCHSPLSNKLIYWGRKMKIGSRRGLWLFLVREVFISNVTLQQWAECFRDNEEKLRVEKKALSCKVVVPHSTYVIFLAYLCATYPFQVPWNKHLAKATVDIAFLTSHWERQSCFQNPWKNKNSLCTVVFVTDFLRMLSV